MARTRYAWKMLRDVADFARAQKAYWMLPLLLLLAFIGLIVVTGQVGAPLLYTLF